MHPFIDEHAVEVAAPVPVVWETLLDWAEHTLTGGPRRPLALILGTQPSAGFEVTDSEPPHTLDLSGRHRFARYRLVFHVDPLGTGEAVLRARSYASFPGLHGRAYRLAVISSGAHVVATRWMLRRVADRAVSRR